MFLTRLKRKYLTPFSLASSGAIFTVALFFYMGRRGWAGTESRCRTSVCWCELPMDGWVAEPWNTWSNMPVFGLSVLMGWLATNQGGPSFSRRMDPAVLGAFTFALWLEATGALFFHAALTTWSQILDASSVLGIWSVVVSSALLRLGLIRKPWLWPLIATGCGLALALRVFVTSHIEGPGLICLIATLLIEFTLARRERKKNAVNRTYLKWALGSLLISFFFWVGALPGGVLCQLEVGHSLWHLLAALAVAFYALHAASFE